MKGSRRVLDGAVDIDIVGKAINAFEVLSHVRRAASTCCCSTCGCPGAAGWSLIRRIRSEAAKLAVLILTMHEEERCTVRAIPRQHAGLPVSKESASSRWWAAIERSACRGGRTSALQGGQSQDSR